MGVSWEWGSTLDKRVRRPRSHKTDLNKDPTYLWDSIWCPSWDSCPLPVVCISKGAQSRVTLVKTPVPSVEGLGQGSKSAPLECFEGPEPSSSGTSFLHSQPQVSLSRSSATALTRHLRASLEAPTPQSPPPSPSPT